MVSRHKMQFSLATMMMVVTAACVCMALAPANYRLFDQLPVWCAWTALAASTAMLLGLLALLVVLVRRRSHVNETPRFYTR